MDWQHARPPCPSPTPRAYSNSRPSSRWCHPTISSCRPLLLPPSILGSCYKFMGKELLPHTTFDASCSVFLQKGWIRWEWPKVSKVCSGAIIISSYKTHQFSSTARSGEMDVKCAQKWSSRNGAKSAWCQCFSSGWTVTCSPPGPHFPGAGLLTLLALVPSSEPAQQWSSLSL